MSHDRQNSPSVARLMLVIFCAMTARCLVAAEPQVTAAGDWESLFDGKTLAGWSAIVTEKDTDRPYWRVEDGVIVGSPAARLNEYVWLLSDREWSDFELTLAIKMVSPQSKGNSGIQIRSRYDYDEQWMDGPQIEVHAHLPWKSGYILDLTRTVKHWLSPDLPDFKMGPEYEPEQWVWYAPIEGDPNSGWNTFRIVCLGPRMVTWVNDVLVTDYDGSGVLDDADHQQLAVGMSGHLAFQMHKNQQLGMQIKDIQIRTVRALSPADP